MKTWITNTEQETESLGAALAPGLFPGAFLALYGGLGAGKTAFCRGLAQALSNEGVTSPTFTIVQEHPGKDFMLFHFDAYRLKNEEELYGIGYFDYLDRNGVILMEWPDIVPGALPSERLDVRIVGAGDASRSITMTPRGVRHQTLLNGLF